MSKDKKLIASAMSMISEDPPADKMLRTSFWELFKGCNIAASDWSGLMESYISNPENGHSDIDKAKIRDRAGRLTTALTGGSKPNEMPEFTWRRFIEGLCIIGADRLTMTMATKRGKFGSSKIVSSATNPIADHRQYVKAEKTRPANKVSVLIGQMFANTKKTATRDMEHILSRLLWSTLDAYSIDKSSWEKQIHRYTHDSNNCPALQYRRNDKKNNLQKAITNTKSLTWNRFMEALKVVDVKNVEITFNIQIGRHAIEVTSQIDLTALSFKSGGKDDCTNP